MIETDRFLPFERAGEVEETAHGLLASVHGERVRIDFVRDDVVRFKISRGGTFDEEPTYALAVDPLAEPVEFERGRGEGTVTLRTANLVVTLGLDPFRLDVERPDGSRVVESSLTYATLNDA